MGKRVENVAIGASVVGGGAAATAGIIAAGSATAGAISAADTTVGAVAGGVLGSGVTIVTAGVGMAATVPFAAARAAIGAWAGPALAPVGIGTVPVWAVPVAIGGGVLATSGLAVGGYKWIKSRKQKAATTEITRA